MAKDFNKVILTGRLTKDPDVRTTQGGQKYAMFNLAVDSSFKDKNTGEWTNKADFIPCQAWGTLASTLEQYAHKGMRLGVEGRLNVRDYDDPKTNTHKWVTSVIISSALFLEKKENSNPPQEQNVIQGKLAEDDPFDGAAPVSFDNTQQNYGGSDVDIPF